MMKKGFYILFGMCMVLLAVSCSNSGKSYTDRLKEEKRAINRLIDSEGFEILKSFPADYKFKPNQFVKLDNDVYINVIDSGNGQRATLYSTEIFSRFTAHRFSLDSTIYRTEWSNYGPNSNGTFPVEFTYGNTTANTGDITTSERSALEALVSEGMQIGLEYVGHGGKVKLIVPFKRGSSEDQGSYLPVYFEILEYKFGENS